MAVSLSTYTERFCTVRRSHYRGCLLVAWLGAGHECITKSKLVNSTMPANHTHPPDGPIDILLVEDNPGDVRLLKESFKATDHEVAIQAIPRGDDAIEQLCDQADSDPSSLPDLALLDLNLPGKHGCEVLNAIRNHPQLSRLPVLILTSSSDGDDVVRCYNADANAYLTKPTGPDDFEELAAQIEQFWFRHATLPPLPA